MTRESYLLFLGIIMVTFSFSIYHSTNAQINSSDINVNNDVIQPITPTSDMNNIQENGQTIDNMNNWTVISGNWTNFDGNPYSGSLANATNLYRNIILNPEFPDNLTEISTSVKVNNLDNSTANYASIVYSFIDDNNYRFLQESTFIIILCMLLVIQSIMVTMFQSRIGPVFQQILHGPRRDIQPDLSHRRFRVRSIHKWDEILVKNDGNNELDLGDVGLNYGRIQDIPLF